VTTYLLGLRGSGKSTVGRLAAERLGGAFIDLDDLTPALLGCATAAEALRSHGEPAFRAAERRALDDPRVRSAAVVALGGGTPTFPPSAEELRARAAAGDHLLYLRASAATLRVRLAATDLSTRPSLTGADPLAEVATLWARRDPAYRALATRVIDVDGLGVDALVEAVLGAPA
jgi:shikimate kinase